jgi:hypothetical protein
MLEHWCCSPAELTAATMKLADCGPVHISVVLHGLQAKTLDLYLAGRRKRVVPTLDRLPVRVITNGAVSRAVKRLDR